MLPVLKPVLYKTCVIQSCDLLALMVQLLCFSFGSKLLFCQQVTLLPAGAYGLHL